MYNFIDTNEVSDGAILPSEALKINGEYIENLIDGYRTLSVAGREALSPELETIETGVRDGSKLKSKRYPARNIIVTYQLIAESSEAYREAYNKLGRILDVEEAELIFNDEQDKFFTGTPVAIGEVEAGRNSVTGEFEILCADPFKYSVIEYEAEASEDDHNTILVDYNGTYKSYPTLEAKFFDENEVSEDGESTATLTGSGDCGYVAFFNEREKIIQLGDPEEVDGSDEFKKSQTLMNQTFKTTSAWGTGAKKLWSVNAGTKFPDNYSQLGDVGIKVASLTVPKSAKTTEATLLSNAKSTASSPTFYYTVKAKAYDRTADSVNVDFAITTSLGTSSSYFGRGLGLQGSIYIAGAWRYFTIKNTSEYWKGNSGHTSTLTVTVTGLTGETAALTGIKFWVGRTDSNGNAGKLPETACANMPISQFTASEPSGYYLAPTGYGSVTKVWHGPSITRTLSADAKGETGASEFILTYKHKMSIGNNKKSSNEYGGFQAQLLDENNAVVVSARVLKHKQGKAARLSFYVKGVAVKKYNIDLSYGNKYLGGDESTIATATIRKSGSKVVFNMCGKKYTHIDDTLKGVKIYKVTFTFEQYSEIGALAYNGLYWAKFVKNNCDTYNDIPNKFSANDIVTADCRSGEVLLNEKATPELGALGNDWEEFYLMPGLNQIGASFSDWVAEGYEPKFKVKYREVFL